MIFCVLNFKTLSFFPELCFSNASDGYKIKLDKKSHKIRISRMFSINSNTVCARESWDKIKFKCERGKKSSKNFRRRQKGQLLPIYIYIGHKYKLNRIVSARCEYCHTRKKAIIQINCVLDITLNINIQFRKNILPCMCEKNCISLT